MLCDITFGFTRRVTFGFTRRVTFGFTKEKIEIRMDHTENVTREKMEVDNDMLEVYDDPDLVLIALSAEIDSIHELDNLDQLNLLIKESHVIQQYNVRPIHEWMEERMLHIYTYRDLDWTYMLDKTRGRNAYLYESSIRVVQAIEQLIAMWNVDQFAMDLYHYILTSIHSIWIHYKNTDMDSCDSVDDLAASMTQM